MKIIFNSNLRFPSRAPFGLFYHAAWFTQPHHKEGFIKFLDTINAMNDVWIVTNWQALQWVRDPTPISRVTSFQPFQCNYSVSTSIRFNEYNRDNRCSPLSPITGSTKTLQQSKSVQFVAQIRRSIHANMSTMSRNLPVDWQNRYPIITCWQRPRRIELDCESIENVVKCILNFLGVNK